MWRPHTADHDFCEPNYTVTPFVVEFHNTYSSLVIAITGALMYLRSKHFPMRLKIFPALVFIIGIGSVAFHGTMKRSGQILDEVPMLFAAFSILYVAVYYRNQKSLTKSWMIFFSSSFAVAIYSYFSLGFEFFIGIYASTIVLTAYVCWNLFEPQSSARLPLQYGASVYAFGFLFLWVPSEVYCENFPSFMKNYSHALFHLTSSFGPHIFMEFMRLTYFTFDLKDSTCLDWHYGFIPYVEMKASND